MKRFEFQTAGRIRFGCGEAARLGEAAVRFGRRALFVTGRDTARWEPLRTRLKANGVASVVFNVDTEPHVEMIEAAVAAAREAACELVVAVGGGSVIDAGKAVAAMLANPGELIDYLEVVGRGRVLTQPSRPCIVLPTTAGTGAEVTRNAVLSAREHKVKVSLRSPHMMPSLAVVDPELTLTMPPPVTAGTGMDALTQLIEALTSAKANPLTDGICRQGLAQGAAHLLRAFEDGGDVRAREGMSLASLFGGLALANAGLGAVHGFAGPLGGMIDAPHGMICAALLPAVMAANTAALRDRAPDSPALTRYREVAGLLTGRPDAPIDDGIAWVHRLVERLALPGLAALGLRRADFDAAVAKAQQASSMKGNPVTLTPEALEGILEAAR
ncbi:MAG: iron-containing alcohol dehydrogenase [Desulfobacterales bacterium]|nr:iron-containing alcohol dehydrogenase [Desulfobacterales bacterium]